MHVRAARRNGLTAAEIQEVLLQAAIYLGVPAANHAFAIAEAEIARFDRTEQTEQTGPIEPPGPTGPTDHKGDQR